MQGETRAGTDVRPGSGTGRTAMTHSHRIARNLCRAAFLLGLGFAVLRAAAEPIPMNAWVHDPVITSVGVSPDGRKLVALTISDVSQPPDVTVWDVANLSAPPKRFRPKDSKAIAVQWLSNDRLFVVGRQAFDIRGRGKLVRTFRNRAYFVDAEGRKFEEVLANKEILSFTVLNLLRNRPDKILVEATNLQFAADIYEVDMGTLLAKRVMRGAEGEGLITDYAGNVRAISRLRGGGEDVRIEFSYKNPRTGEWEMHHALYAVDRGGMTPVAFDPDGRTVYMSDSTDGDKAVISTYDLLERKVTGVAFGDASIEATGVIQSPQPEEYGKVIGFTGWGPAAFQVYSDPEWAALQEAIDAALPDGRNNRITSISLDFRYAVVNSSGPREPGEYYLMEDARNLVLLGRERPLLDPAKLAEMRFVTYAARDGLTIPAFLTVPVDGGPPYPAVVMPHGGPWARDFLGFDLWAQFLANRGYVVLQPQYRGSEGWGKALWMAGDREWGRRMQDDKDDGAGWLVEQGLADPDRIAIYGYSYGGYAAMAAIVRPDTPYQCAIAGAGLSELRTFDKVTFENPFNRMFQNPTVAGLSPLDHAADARIPIFIFHGDRDQRVPIEQSEKFVAALEKADKDVEYLQIPDLWHSYPWLPQHHLAVLSSIEEYLGERCGPGGL